VYVLAPARSMANVTAFRERWLEGFEQSADEYEFPQYAASPDHVHASPWPLIDELLRETDEPHALYWHNPRAGEVGNAMLFFTSDGAMIAGLTVHDEEPISVARYLGALGDTLHADYGYVVWEEPPPDTREEFLERTADAGMPKLEGGRLITS
jgi:hypothetical protein